MQGGVCHHGIVSGVSRTTRRTCPACAPAHVVDPVTLQTSRGPQPCEIPPVSPIEVALLGPKLESPSLLLARSGLRPRRPRRGSRPHVYAMFSPGDPISSPISSRWAASIAFHMHPESCSLSCLLSLFRRPSAPLPSPHISPRRCRSPHHCGARCGLRHEMTTTCGLCDEVTRSCCSAGAMSPYSTVYQRRHHDQLESFAPLVSFAAYGINSNTEVCRMTAPSC